RGGVGGGGGEEQAKGAVHEPKHPLPGPPRKGEGAPSRLPLIPGASLPPPPALPPDLIWGPLSSSPAATAPAAARGQHRCAPPTNNRILAVFIEQLTSCRRRPIEGVLCEPLRTTA